MKAKEKNIENPKKQTFNKMLIVNIILAIVFEIVMVFVKKTFSGISIARGITAFGLLNFIGLHYVWGAPNLYNKIIKNRFVITGIMVVLTTILGFFMNPLGLGEWLTSIDVPLCLVWNLEFYGLLLVSYEMFYLITNKKQGMSVIATISLVLSTLVQLHFSYIALPLISIQLIVLLINKVITSKKNIIRITFSILAIILSIVTVLIGNMEYVISFAYIGIGLILWLFVKNKEVFKKKSILVISLITLAIAFIIPTICRNIFLEKETFFVDRNNISNLFYYLSNVYIPYFEIENAFKISSIYSLFPIPLLIALYYLYKKEGHTGFLLPMVLGIVFEILLCANVFPHSFKEVVGYTQVRAFAITAGISLGNLYVLFYILGNITDMKFETKHAIRFVLVIMCVLIFIRRPLEFDEKKFLFYNAAHICAMTFLFMFWTEKKYRNTFLAFLMILTIVGGITINPILKEKKEVVKPPEEIIYYN